MHVGATATGYIMACCDCFYQSFFQPSCIIVLLWLASFGPGRCDPWWPLFTLSVWLETAWAQSGSPSGYWDTLQHPRWSTEHGWQKVKYKLKLTNRDIYHVRVYTVLTSFLLLTLDLENVSSEISDFFYPSVLQSLVSTWQNSQLTLRGHSPSAR